MLITVMDDLVNIQMPITLKMGEIFQQNGWEERPLEHKSFIYNTTLQPSGKLFKRIATANPLKNLPPREVDKVVA